MSTALIELKFTSYKSSASQFQFKHYFQNSIFLLPTCSYCVRLRKPLLSEICDVVKVILPLATLNVNSFMVRI